MNDKKEGRMISFPTKSIPYEPHCAVFIPWEGLRDAAAERISAVIGRTAMVKVDIEEYDWWAFSLTNTKITPYEMHLLFIAFDAGEQDIKDNTMEPEELATAGLSDGLSLKIVRDLIPLRSVAASIAAQTGLWMIDARTDPQEGYGKGA